MEYHENVLFPQLVEELLTGSRSYDALVPLTDGISEIITTSSSRPSGTSIQLMLSSRDPMETISDMITTSSLEPSCEVSNAENGLTYPYVDVIVSMVTGTAPTTGLMSATGTKMKH